MSLLESNTPDFSPDPEQNSGQEPVLSTRPAAEDDPSDERNWFSPRRLARFAGFGLIALLILCLVGFFAARVYLRNVATSNLPQLDGSLAVPGLTSPVTVQRDAHGVPHIQANSIDDLVFAQGFVTTSDRLFQMDMLRRHAAGELAEILGVSLVAHDRLQRTLQIRASADRAIAQLPPDQLHVLEAYARGVNASIAQQSAHLPIEFRILRYKPAPWSPRDSILVSLAMFQDLTNAFPTKLAREALLLRVPPQLRAQLDQDLYPVGSWRDHPPSSPIPDLTIEGPPIEDIPLDESQSSNKVPSPLPSSASAFALTSNSELTSGNSFIPGSNNWVVSGAHTASGKPLLSNDMHLSHSVPGIWYEADLQAPSSDPAAPFHAAGVSIPGLPLIVVGHNDHIAWGFTNLGADVQDVYIEAVRNPGPNAQFRSTDGSWQPVVRVAEPIRIHGLPTENFVVAFTRHGDALTPILDPALTPAAVQNRVLSLRWTIYDPSTLQLPTLAVDSAHDWPSFLAAFALFGGPSQNVVYADDQGHIGYHAVGRIPLRGPAPAWTASPTATPEALPADIASPDAPRSPTSSPTIAANPNPLARTDIQAPATPVAAQFSGPIAPFPFVPTPAHEWQGYIPFDQLPQVFDPPGGILATANSRTTPDDYRYPITLNWAAPYRTERIWKSLIHRTGLRPEDMLALQSDIYSDFDHVLAQRLAYALDESLAHPARPLPETQSKTMHQAADLLRTFNGRSTTDSPAAAVVAVVHNALWPALLAPQLKSSAPGAAPDNWEKRTVEINSLYLWGEKDYALEQILAHTPPRWLPPAYANWNDFLASVTVRALANAHAPTDLATLRYGATHTLDIEHPIFDQSPLLQRIFGLPTGTGPQPQSGDGTTIKQVGRTFGPSERFTADLANLQHSTLNLVLGESGNPVSPWFLDQFSAWHRGSTFPQHAPPIHTLTLTP